MIRNLNQLNFNGFGTVAPERKSQPDSTAGRKRLLASQDHAPIYRAESDTWLYGVTGMTVLSVSTDGENFQDFYLDKTVCIRPGVYFCISPFRQEQACADYDSATAPKQLSVRPAEDLLVQHDLKVTRLYTFFYQEKEQGFFFAGEQHPMLELTYVDQGSLHSVADGVDLTLQLDLEDDLCIFNGQFYHYGKPDTSMLQGLWKLMGLKTWPEEIVKHPAFSFYFQNIR